VSLPAALRRSWCGRRGVLVAGLVFFDCEASRSLVVELPPSLSSRIPGFVELFLPSPDPAWRPIRVLLFQIEVLLRCSALKSAALGAGSPDPLTSDFPSVEGVRPIQGSCGAGAAARRWLVRVDDGDGIQEELCVIFF
jgi:hypothetical protein